MKNIFCVGEVLIDFVAENQGSDLSTAKVFTKKPGGAPANVACAISKLGGNSHFIGAVGSDPFGRYLLNVLEKNGVKTNLVQHCEMSTTLAFVSIDKDGERDFVFNRGADKELKYNPTIKTQFHGNILHLGAATALLGGNLEDSYGRYLFDAITQNAFISFDPNFRTDLWKGNEECFIKKCLPIVEKSHLCKFSLEEAQLLSGCEDLVEACDKLHKIGAKAITITLGGAGTYVSTPSFKKTIGSIKVKPVDTTGAGDAFIGCLLYQIARLKNPLDILTATDDLEKMIFIANKAGAVTTTKFGAIPALPSKKDIF